MASEFKILPQIKSPADLRRLSIPELTELAEEIRRRIIGTISKIGGHFGASMGAVELTLALHYVLETPRDQIVWDVGHQAYAHKIITGRNDRFDTIRQTGGLSGFLRRDESEYDAFGAGHASTSISAALGIAKARDITGEKFRVCAVIGDCSMSGGLAYEAINNAGYLGTDLIVVLNDNEMSISHNVGAIARYFNRIITDYYYNLAKEDVEYMIQRIPMIGQRLLDLTHKVESSAKGLILPGKFFENLGFRYLGPLNGHDLNQLIATLARIKDFNGPILLHIATRKGKGYELSERDPARWHAPGLFEPSTGKIQPQKAGPPSYTSVFGNVIVAEAARNPRIAAITAAMTPGVGLDEFAQLYPERFFDVGIAEGHAVTFAAGLAAKGVLPVVCIYSTFLQRAYDNIVHDVALQNLHVVFCLDRAGIVGEDGPTHHGAFDLSYLRSIPGMTIMAPADEAELAAMLRLALEGCQGPVAIRYPRGASEGVPIPEIPETIEIGKAKILSEGSDAMILAIGRMVSVAREAAKSLEKQDGLSVGVVNMRFVKPLDQDALRRAALCARNLFSLEENTIVGGMGSGINEALAEINAGNPEGCAFCHMLGLPDQFISHAAMRDIFDTLKLTPEGVAAQIRGLLRK
ncbi:MAG: 1-deoxy-D-xylulose-5-phosphate synthase [Candidatus Sumerlaeota bacterium]|nr:1-deoxy-D-xylulose-5-phosphate synthase [Candidatus Sumerlaeota bacterium]